MKMKLASPILSRHHALAPAVERECQTFQKFRDTVIGDVSTVSAFGVGLVYCPRKDNFLLEREWMANHAHN